MQFLDAIGLAYFWEKIKASFVSTKGESVINTDDDNSGLSVENRGSATTTLTPSGFVSYNTIGDETDMVARLQYGDLLLSKIHLKYGTSSQILIADGSTKTINAANGICGLDTNGNVPLANLGNLDTTVAEVVTALPTSNIKRHIYLVKDSDTANNKYAEYVYTGDISAAYDSTKWEKLGDFRATVDLADYAKKSETVDLSTIRVEEKVLTISPQGQILEQVILFSNLNDENTKEVVFKDATSNMAGFMSIYDKNKLDGIANGANNYSLPLAANGTRGGIQVGYAANGRNYPVQLSGEKAYVNVPWTDTNTTYDLSPYAKTADVNVALSKKVDVVSGKGLSTHDFTSAYKSKLDGISSGATADSAITTAEIDALFA